MRPRPLMWFAISLLCLAGAWYFWRLGNRWAAQKQTPPNVPGAPAASTSPAATRKQSSARTTTTVTPASTAPFFLLTQSPAERKATNRFPYRLSNTTKKVGQLLRDDRAILLENAIIDTRLPLGFSIPERLRAQGDPGSYIVQSRGAVSESFRAALDQAGARIVSYIPNNAYLVRLSEAGARQLQAGGQTVLPFEPPYKLKSDLLRLAMEEEPLPFGAKLNVMLFADARDEVIGELERQGIPVLAESRSPFGPVLTIQPSEDWPALARLSGVQVVELFQPRVSANDLSRARLGVALDSAVETNYLNLTGNNVLVNVNDTGVDATHPDLTGVPGKVTGDFPASLVDSNGHGTHVAGIIAGSGAQSLTVSNAQGSVMPATNGQFRGKAPGAKVFSMATDLSAGVFQSDAYLQERAAQTNALISNNSWHFGNNNTYGIGAANYDAAVRDALPEVTGSQPLIFVFAAGNSGDGDDAGLSGDPESILSPGTAKNVITVGAIELARDITNEVVLDFATCRTTNINGTNVTICSTNTPWRGMTSSDNQVAAFSSRGNVGIGIEGDFGRFKPDLVAPGTFVVSTRSTMWDQKAYYNPTSHHFNAFFNQLIITNRLHNYNILVPPNAVQLFIDLSPNVDSPSPFPNLPIFVRQSANPTTNIFDFVRTNSVSMPPDNGPGLTPVGVFWRYGVGNPTPENVNLNILTDILTTNDVGNQLEVLSNLNNSLSGVAPHYYRYESGSSMAAADASGTLALLQEFFQRVQVTNSPALMKALLINGARSVGTLYDFQVQNTINFQGWGLINLPNSLPTGGSNVLNALTHTGRSSLQIFEQSPATALATGQSQTRLLNVSEPARQSPLRLTLVWTDPPGNPVAGVKLVNDLDLIVTNLDTGEIFRGNDIRTGSNFTFAGDTNTPPVVDSINNVENVYLTPPLGSNYAVTVVAQRVNVNAVTAHTNEVAQDYALVISAGNGAGGGEASDALSVTEQPLVRTQPLAIGTITNSFQSSQNSLNPVSGSFLLGQHVGANTPLLGTTNGITNQWHFYVITNDTTFTNAAFVTFLPPTLALPRMGVHEDLVNNATRIEADIDLYVSLNPALLNLDPAAIAGADRSRNRGGTELVVYSNSAQGLVYYIGVKAEDQMAAEYAFLAVFSRNPFSERDSEGNLIVQGLPLPAPIPDGTPADPGAALVLGLATQPVPMRRVIVTNAFYHENPGDLVGTLSHGQRFAVLNNHRGLLPGLPPDFYGYAYEDNGEQLYTSGNPSFRPTDGPGSLRDFVGEEGLGVWLLAMVDNSLGGTGVVQQVGGYDGLTLRLEPQDLDGSGTNRTVPPNTFTYDFIDVPLAATNLTVCVFSNTAPVELYIRRGAFPTRTTYDYFLSVTNGGDCLSIDKADLPPLTADRYYIGVYNPNVTAQLIRIIATVDLDLAAIVPILYNSVGDEPLRDDAVTYSSIFVNQRARIASVDVGLRVNHPRESDLVFHLISPRGTRVLLMENRGGTDSGGIGSSFSITNVVPVSTNGGAAAVTNVIDTGTTVGTLTIDYEFFPVPDQMTVYYEGLLLTNSGMISGAGRFNLNYGPGSNTLVTIIMNEFGNASSNTAWNYTVSSINSTHNYLTFTENTNLTTTPIKFAPPPFVPTAGSSNLFISGFEPPPAGDYVTPAVIDGWNVLTSNRVSVLADPLLAHTGTKSLALLSGQIQRTLPTTAGSSYQLSFAYRKRPTLEGIVAWWPGEGAATDIVGANHGTLQNGAGFAPGNVNAAFNFGGGSHVRVGTYPGLTMSNAFSVEAWIFPTGPGGNPIYGGMILNKEAQYELARFADGTIQWTIANTGPIWLWVNTGYVAPLGQWTHVALTYDLGLTKTFANGVLVHSYQGSGPVGTVPGYFPNELRIGDRQDLTQNQWFQGRLDEVTLYNRALTDAEVQAIYAAGSAGKCGMVTPPGVCPVSGAQVFVPGQITNTFVSITTNWVTNTLTFTASQNGTPVGLSPVPGGQSGVLLDTFTLIEGSGPLYYLPEESLKALVNENVFGEWRLEILDNRTGATNQASLVSWQLQFVFQTDVPTPGVLTHGVPLTNSVPPGQIAYYIVDVPALARFATNTLLFASGNVNILFNQNTPPTGTNALDFTLIANSMGPASRTLSTNVVPPPRLLPGQRYYLGVQNPGVTAVTYALEVTFDLFSNIITLTNGIPYFNTMAAAASATDYYRYVVTSNALRAQFEINGPSADLTLVARKGLPLPDLATYDYLSANPNLNDELIVTFTNSTPVALSAGDWFLSAVNVSGGPASYAIKATEWPVTGLPILVTGVSTTTNAFCLTWDSLPGVHYVVEGLTNLSSATWVGASPTLTAPGASTTYCVPLPSPLQFFRVREGVVLLP